MIPIVSPSGLENPRFDRCSLLRKEYNAFKIFYYSNKTAIRAFLRETIDPPRMNAPESLDTILCISGDSDGSGGSRWENDAIRVDGEISHRAS